MLMKSRGIAFSAAALVVCAIVYVLWPDLRIVFLGLPRPAVVVVNDAVQPMRNVSLVLGHSGGRVLERRAELLPSESMRVVVDTSDLYIVSLDFESGEAGRTYGGGLATPGESIVLGVYEGGAVVAHRRTDRDLSGPHSRNEWDIPDIMDADEMYYRGLGYDAGVGATEDDEQAILRYHKAADQGDPRAQYRLGMHYASGEGVEQDLDEAVAWFRLAADRGRLGFAPAQFRLGLAYDNGEGVPQDQSQAAHWYRMAARNRHAPAQLELAVRYAAGNGVPVDDVRALYWLRKAAKHGVAGAQYQLGVRYYTGCGVRRDRDAALRLLRLAAAQGHQDAREFLDESVAQ